MILVITGKTATGKTTIIQELVQHYGFHRVITYTTRKKRNNEVNGKDYHFITNEQFKEMIQNNELLEYDCIPQSYGDTYYGSKKEDYTKYDRTVVALTQSGCMKLEKKIIIRLEATDQTIYDRLIPRGWTKENIEARLKKDNEWNLTPDLIIQTDDKTVKQIALQIMEYINEIDD